MERPTLGAAILRWALIVPYFLLIWGIGNFSVGWFWKLVHLDPLADLLQIPIAGLALYHASALAPYGRSYVACGLAVILTLVYGFVAVTIGFAFPKEPRTALDYWQLFICIPCIICTWAAFIMTLEPKPVTKERPISLREIPTDE
jgi:hypothetical protein